MITHYPSPRRSRRDASITVSLFLASGIISIAAISAIIYVIVK